MRIRLVLRTEAESEILEAKAWYESRREGLGHRFATSVETTIAGIVATPLAFPRVRGDLRRALVSGFPYAVYYQHVAPEVIILAIFHGRRHPRSWRSRSTE